MSKAEFVRDIVRTNPLLIPHTLKNPEYNSKMTHAIMYDLLPFKLGIEIECGGNVILPLFNQDIDNFDQIGLKAWQHVLINAKNYYNVDSFSVDCNEGVRTYCEHRIRIVGYKHLFGLYRILEDMKKHCKINVSGGLHIHVDFSDLFGENYTSRKVNKSPILMKNTQFYTNIERRKRKIATIFEQYVDQTVEFFQYTGSFSPKMVTTHKNGVISLREETVEFRCGECTFDYEKIVSQLIYVSQICKRVKKCFGKHY